MLGVVYKGTNKVNGKGYIGITRASVFTRIHQHKRMSGSGRTTVGNAIKKYGWQSFIWEVLGTTEDLADLYDMERGFIASHNTFACIKGGHGYNRTSGGGGLCGVNDPWDEKQRRVALGRQPYIMRAHKTLRGSGGPVKLTAAKVLNIRKDPRVNLAIAKEYGVSEGVISKIKLRRKGYWAWLEDPKPEKRPYVMLAHKSLLRGGGRRKLTSTDVLAIRGDTRTNVVIAKEYGVTGGTIGAIKNRSKGCWLWLE